MMASKRLFNGIAHDIAHHAQSGLSYLHPHIVRYCQTLCISELDVSLLSPQEGQFSEKSQLLFAVDALQLTFQKMLENAYLNIADLSSAHLIFYPIPGKDDYSTAVRSCLELRDGRSYSRTIPVIW